MFTDVVQSSKTKRDQSFGNDTLQRDQAYIETVQVPHFERVRECLREHGGREISTIGDSFFLTFDEPIWALRFSARLLTSLAKRPIATPFGPMQLRIGLNSGSPQWLEDSYHGTDVDIAARAEGEASPSQILLTDATYALVKNISDMRFHEKGERDLHGIGPTNLWELDWDGTGPRACKRPSDKIERNLVIGSDIPEAETNLPIRTQELRELEKTISTHRVVVLYGPDGGEGKTSLLLKWAWSPEQIPGVQKTLYFSFYAQQRDPGIGMMATEFLEFCVRELAGPNERELLNRLTGSKKAERLYDLATQSGTAFALDGLEPMLDSSSRVFDRGLERLLEIAERKNAVPIVITTRRKWGAHGPRGIIEIGALSGDDQELVLKPLMNQALRKRIKASLNGHLLAMLIAVSYVKMFPTRADFLLTESPLHQDDVRKPLARVLHDIGALDGSSSWMSLLKAVTVFVAETELEDAMRLAIRMGWLRKGSPSQGLLTTLRDLNLRPRSRVDSHPRIREYFQNVLRSEDATAWKRANDTLFKHILNSSKPITNATTKEEFTKERIASLVHAMHHGVEAGQSGRAFREVYKKRMQGETRFFTNVLNKSGTALDAIRSLFNSETRPFSEFVDKSSTRVLD